MEVPDLGELEPTGCRRRLGAWPIRRILGGPALVVAAGAVAACTAGPGVGGGASPSPAEPSAVEVTIIDLEFRPPSIALAPGSALTFTSRDAVGHTVTEGAGGITARGARFDEPLPPGGRVTVTLADPGILAVTCRIHPRMQLTVSVGDAGSTAGPATAPTTPAPDPYDDGY